MKLYADLHLHSRFSRATSKDLTIRNLEKWGKVKGLNLLGTGDFSHPEWIKELKNNLHDDGSGILKSSGGMNFILQNEISLIYTQDGRGRRVHLILLAPNFDAVDKITQYLLTKGRIDYDGRPIFKIPAHEFVYEMQKIDKDIEVIPAHIWTPWFGLLGEKSGFNSLKEAFKDQTKHVHAIETGLSCYDKETDVLTEEGWKKFSKLSYKDKICTLNKKHHIEFQEISKMFISDYKGPMYRLRTKRVDLLVTPNHRLFVSHCDFRKKPEFLLKESEQVFNKSKRFKKDGSWEGEQSEYFILPAVKIKHGSKYYSGSRYKKEKKFPIKSWLKYFGFWIAEGWVSEGKNGDYNVCVSNTDEKIINEMKDILKELGFSPLYLKKANTLRVRDFQLFNYLKKFGKSVDKYIPLEVKNLSKNLLKIFFKYYIIGDGHIYGRDGKGLSATTISIKLRDDLQELALRIGISAYYKLHQPKGTPFSSPSQNKIYKQSADSWNIYFIRQNIHTVLPSTIRKNKNYVESWIDFKGKVYCVSVPNKVIYIRRNGIPIWCGNSDPPMNWRIKELDNIQLISNSDSHSFWPWRIGREANIFELKELNYKNILNAIRTDFGLQGTIEVDPSYGKYHFTGHRECNISLSPEEAKKLNNICPVCGKKLTIGVLERVEELATRAELEKPDNTKPFFKLIPLSELISTVVGKAVATKTVWAIYNQFLAIFKNELNVLLEASYEELAKIDVKIADVIIKNRKGEIKVKPGYDGVYGVPLLGQKIPKTALNINKKLF